MDRKKYRRYFVILDHEDEGFQNKEGELPKGYTKIETKNGKGVLNHYIENMKYFENAEYMYKGYLIGTKDNIYVENGIFIIDEDGKGELNWRFDPDNVDGKGHPITDFNVIAIMAKPKVGGKEVATPLVGFIDKKKVAFKHVVEENQNKSSNQDNSHPTQSIDKVKEEKVEKEQTKEEDLYKKDTEQELFIEVQEEKKDTEEKEDIVEKEEIEIEPKQEIKTEEVQDEVCQKDSQEEEKIMADQEEYNPENKQIVDEYSYHQRIINGFRRYEENEYAQQSQSMRDYDCKNPYEYYKQYFKMVSGYVENILKYYPMVEPFEKNMKNCTWWKIDCSQQTLYRNFLPFYGYINYMYSYIPYTPYTSACPSTIYKYRHYIFGIMKDEKGEVDHYLYGVPGRFILSEQPYEGKTGFVYWQSLEDKKAEKGDYGYWILHIDAKTGNTVFPKESIIPPC